MLKVHVCLCGHLYLCRPLHLYEPLYLRGVVLLSCGPFTPRAFHYDMGPYHPREAPLVRAFGLLHAGIASEKLSQVTSQPINKSQNKTRAQLLLRWPQ